MKQFKNDFIAFATSTNSLTPVYTKNGMLDHYILLDCNHVIIEKDGGYNYGIMDIYCLVGYNEVEINIINEGNVK